MCKRRVSFRSHVTRHAQYEHPSAPQYHPLQHQVLLQQQHPLQQQLLDHGGSLPSHQQHAVYQFQAASYSTVSPSTMPLMNPGAAAMHTQISPEMLPIHTQFHQQQNVLVPANPYLHEGNL